jgi:hypothetical protein
MGSKAMSGAERCPSVGAGLEDSVARLAVRGSVTAGLAAICWIALGMESILRPQQENYRDAIWMIPFALTAGTFVFVHAVQRSREARFERFSFYVVMTASVLVFLGNVGLLASQPILARFSFPWGALLWTVGLIAFGIATLRAKILPAYTGIVLILLEPASILTALLLAPIAPLHERGGYSGGVEKGVVLAVIAMGLRSVCRRLASGEAAL